MQYFLDDFWNFQKLIIDRFKKQDIMEYGVWGFLNNEIWIYYTKMKQEIEKLPKKIREIFVLSKSEGLTNLEISSHMGISIKTVESNITKAYKILKRKMES